MFEQEEKNCEAQNEAMQEAVEETVTEATPDVMMEKSVEEKMAELNDQYLRLRADFDNYRKRMAREANDIRERSKIMVVSDFLPVYDFFQMAMQHAEQTEDFNALKQGMTMIMNEFKRAFDGLGIQEIDTTGKVFDPQLHEAVQTEASNEIPEGVILRQWKAGYKIGDKLVRPSVVVVSAGPEKTEEAAEDK